MYSIKDDKIKRKSPGKNIAFYISLAVCIAAIAGAAWTTYGSVDEYTHMSDNTAGTTKQNESSLTEQKTEKEKTPERSDAGLSFIVSVQESSAAAEENSAVERVRAVAAEPTEPESCRPTSGDIIKPYSPLVPVRSATMNDYRTHSGVDYSAEEGSAVKAVMNGKVKKIYTDAMLGNIICIEHEGGYEAFYCGVTDTPSVAEGDTVEMGQTIGFIGKIPSECRDESHLHFEMKNSKGTIDPTGVI